MRPISVEIRNEAIDGKRIRDVKPLFWLPRLIFSNRTVGIFSYLRQQIHSMFCKAEKSESTCFSAQKYIADIEKKLLICPYIMNGFFLRNSSFVKPVKKKERNAACM